MKPPHNPRVLLAISILGCFACPLLSQQANTPIQLPGITVSGSLSTTNRPGWLGEEQYVGAYGQPDWTTARRFPSTRVYLQQLPWDTGAEQWVRFQHFRDGTDYTRFQEEFEIGLPHRFQVDLYETWGGESGLALRAGRMLSGSALRAG